MRLHNLPKTEGLKKRKRVGRGEGSGRGKTSGRGNKGARARTGYSLRPGFESGHIPLYRKLPKRGFNNYAFRTEFAIINVGDLARLEGKEATPETLAQAGLVRSGIKFLKILGEGEIGRALTVSAHRFSATARAKIEQAGGSVVVLPGAPEPKAEAEATEVQA